MCLPERDADGRFRMSGIGWMMILCMGVCIGMAVLSGGAIGWLLN